MQILLLGPPGAGKGSQAAILARDKGLTRISPGDILRDHINKKTQLGEEAKTYMEAGQLLPVKLIIDIFSECLAQSGIQRGFVGDGLVRNESQAQALDQALIKAGISLDLVIHIAISDAEAISRIEGRRTCVICGEIYHIAHVPPQKGGVCDLDGGALNSRTDDILQTIQNRLQIYHESSPSIITYYRTQGLYRTVDGMRPIRLVRDAIKLLIEDASGEAPRR